MKSPVKIFLILAVFSFIVFSCQEKEGSLTQRINTEIDTVAGMLAEELLTVEIQGGDENRSFGFRVLETEFKTQSDAGKNNNIQQEWHKNQVQQSRLIKCLQDLDLDADQIRESRNLILGMVECRIDAFQSLREELTDIILAMEIQRLTLLEKLLKREINRDEFMAGLQGIRESFKNEIQEIRKKHIDLIKPCLRDMVSNLRELVGEEKWNSLYDCVTS